MKVHNVRPYPISLCPIFVEKVWGGQRLASALGKPLPPHKAVGESWELVDLPGQNNQVAAGPARGVDLHQLIRGWGEGLMGRVALDGGRFPLLVKYIDAAQTLSVQVHPDAEAAARLGGRPKSEAWYILDVAQGGAIYRGLKPGVTREDLARAVEARTVEDLLVRLTVRPGDLVPVPPGTVHAIGAGVLLAEVQQPSDTTYRVHDWGRKGLDGRPRQLHVDEALQSIHFGEDPPAVVRRGEIQMRHFRILLGRLGKDSTPAAAGEIIQDQEGPVVVVGLGGEARVEVEDHAPLSCGPGQVVLVPHQCRPMRIVAPAGARILQVVFPLPDL